MCTLLNQVKQLDTIWHLPMFDGQICPCVMGKFTHVMGNFTHVME